MTRAVRTPRGRARVVLGGVVGIFAVAAVLPPDGTGLPLCPFRAATGVPCPFCGATRATIALAHADVSAALQQNVVWPVVLLLLALTAAIALVRPRVLGRVSGLARGPGLVLAAGVLVAVGWAWGLAHAGTIAPPG